MVDADTFWSLCGSVPVLHGGLLAGLFVAGAAGSVMHCAPMCGGFVLGQVSDRLARVPVERLCERHRLSAALALPYHLGRLTTYAGLGGLLGRLAGYGRIAPWLLVLAAALFLLFALRRLSWLERAPGSWVRLIRGVVRLLPRGTLAGQYALGVALGFLPCGFLYAALTAAGASGSPVLGAAGMLAFGIGTVPVLAMVGFAGAAAERTWSRSVRAAAPVVMALNAAVLLVLAWRGLV